MQKLPKNIFMVNFWGENKNEKREDRLCNKCVSH